MVSVFVSGILASAVGSAGAQEEGQDAPLPRGDVPLFGLVCFLSFDGEGGVVVSGRASDGSVLWTSVSLR